MAVRQSADQSAASSRSVSARKVHGSLRGSILGVPPWTDPRSFGKVRRVIRKYEAKVTTPALGTDFAIPMFFVEGAQDLLATPDVAQRYYDSLKAPQKHMVLLETAGHDPNQDVIDAEYKLLVDYILPLVK